MNLGDRADGRARVMAGCLLLDRDGRREPFDQIDIRLVHALQKLPGIGGERFDIAPLAFGVKRIEGERGFARAGESGDDDHVVARQVEIDVFQVVRARAANPDFC